MAIPDEVKRKAMDAVSHSETTAQIRAYRTSGQTVSLEQSYPVYAGPEVSPISDEVKRQAMDAVSHRETSAQIRLVRDNGEITPPLTPTRHSQEVAEKISRMHKEGQEMDSIQQNITKDGFGREYA